ncbi:MAG: dTDP-4-dehydrorhamnose reductase [Actinobacteria bacterium]|nr:dTDP-4-dehydrorhamnose reductase [Actinomycetota bacterium]
MKWAVLGHAGMLGQDFMSSLAERDVTGFDRAEFDITDLNSVKSVLTGFDVVINCAAWTAVDDAEEKEPAALAINGDGPKNVAVVCKEISAKFVHISTDYVFGGDATSPYSEDALVGPKSAYGRTKLAGEIAIREILPLDHYIVRTAWLYGEHGPNFIKTMLNLEKTKDTISVVDDQIGQPTWTKDLVSQIIEMVDREVPSGTYHGTSSGQTSWFGLTQRIYELIEADPNRVLPTTTEAFPRPAPRPAYSVLGHGKWKAIGMTPIRNWDQALIDAFETGAFN